MEDINSVRFVKYFTSEFFNGRFINWTKLKGELKKLSKFLNWILILQQILKMSIFFLHEMMIPKYRSLE